MTVRGVDDKRVDARVEQLLRLSGHIAVDADSGGDTQLPVHIRGRRVEGGTQGALAGEDAGELAVGVDGGRVPAVGAVEAVERLARVDVGVEEQEVLRHDLGELGEAVHAGQVGVGDHTDGPMLGVDDHARVVRPLGQQGQGVGDGLVGASTIGVSSTR